MPELKSPGTAPELASSAGSSAEVESTETVVVYNQSEGSLMHDEHVLRPGASLEVPVKVAKAWMNVTHLGRPRVILASDMLKGTKTVTSAEADALRSERDALAAAKGENETKVANLEALVRQLQGQIAAPKPGKGKGGKSDQPEGTDAESPPAS